MVVCAVTGHPVLSSFVTRAVILARFGVWGLGLELRGLEEVMSLLARGSFGSGGVLVVGL